MRRIQIRVWRRSGIGCRCVGRTDERRDVGTRWRSVWTKSEPELHANDVGGQFATGTTVVRGWVRRDGRGEEQ